MSDRASSLKDNDLRSKLKKQRNRSGNVSGEEALTVIQSESPSNALIKDNKNDRGITSSIKGDSPSIPKETDLRVLLNKQRMETVVDEEFQSGRPSETLFTDLRADLNNTGSKPADFRQIIEKTRTSRTHERSLEGTKIDDIGHHKDKSDSSLDSYYTPLAAGSMGMGTYSKQYENSETRRVKSVNLRTNEERYPKAYTSIHRDSGYNDHVSKDVENERAIIKYDDLFDA